MHLFRKIVSQLLGCLLLVVIMVACSSTSTTNQATSTPTTSAFTPPNRCQPASPIDYPSVGPEAHGAATNAELWALIQSTSGIPVLAKQDVKIVWRMTGSGAIHFAAYSPTGRHIAPIWGPDEHSGSNWDRPGGEWGAGFNFPTPGCWDIHVTRDHATGDVWLDIA